MAIRKSTIRHYGPVTKRYARLLNKIEGDLRTAKHMLPEINRLELDSMALVNATGKPALSQEEAERRFPHLFKDKQEVNL